MKLLSVTLCRFGSFKDEVTFHFPDGPGLFFLRGENEQEPALEANGAGKSTLWNALGWVGFDRTVKGLRAGDVANWEDPKAAYVRLLYVDDLDTQIEVRRQHAPNKWELSADGEPWIDLAKHPDNPFLADLRLELEPFMNCILMGQGRPMFIDLPATKKAELFSDVLGLDVWLERSKKAGAKAQEQDAVLRELERKLSGVEGQLRGIDHSALEGSAGDWKKDNERRQIEVNARFEKALAARREKKAQVVKLEEQLASARAQLKKDTADADLTNERRHRAKEAARVATRAAEEGERYCHAETEAIQRFRKLADCPTCKQRVPHEHRTDIADALQVKLTAKAREQADLWAAEKLAKDELELCAAEVERFDSFVAQCWSKVDALSKDAARAANDLAYLDKDLDRLEDEAERIGKERNPFASMKQEALDQEATLQSYRDDLQRRLDEAHERHYLLTFWVKGFKEMRLQLINESLQQLEIEVNSNVAEKGLLGWELRFEVDKETKGGGVTRGFNVRVLSPHNERSGPWESWSGGEGQRLRVATQEGLADLIRDRTGCTLELEIWDEPTEHLSGQGVTDLLDSLAQRARRKQRQIWVVDHRALGFGNFTDVYTVIKDANGSRIESKQ